MRSRSEGFAEFVELGVMGSDAIGWKTVVKHARVCNAGVGGEVVDRWTKRARERLTMESAACGIGSFEHYGLRSVDSTVEVDIRRRSLQILSTSKTFDCNHHDLVDNIAIFSTSALVCYCSLDLSSRRTVYRVKVRQALTSYLVVHLTNSTTLIAHI